MNAPTGIGKIKGTINLAVVFRSSNLMKVLKLMVFFVLLISTTICDAIIR